MGFYEMLIASILLCVAFTGIVLALAVGMYFVFQSLDNRQ